MQTSSKLLGFIVAAALALPLTACVTNTTSTTATTSSPLTGDGGALCCASIEGTDVPSCTIPDDCCSGNCGKNNICECANTGGYCAVASDCCSGACSIDLDASPVLIGHCQ
jgi:hypothetical protein